MHRPSARPARGRPALILLLAAPAGPAAAQAPVPPPPRVGTDSVMVAADSRFRSGTVHRFLFGNHYRYIWTVPVKAPVLDLAHFDGGLTPTKVGGGQQTQSLRFDGANHRQWVFRTVQKDARAIMPESMRHSFLADLVNDQVSHSHPGGALSVPPMLDALGILHATPQLAVMPDDPRLGEFREAFAGRLGALEEFPDDGPDGTPGFAGSTKIGSSGDLLQQLSKAPDDRVDARAFLTARLFDLLINDWDRHKDQWKWARYDRGDDHLWEPIPRDRDQAYSWMDGFFPTVARMGVPKLIGFGTHFPGLTGLTFNGRELDLALLNGLDRAAWDSVARFVQTRLTDSVIDAGLARMPPQYRELTGALIRRNLISRRALLPAEADRLYDLLARVVDIHATDAPDLARIDRDSTGGLRVRLYDGRSKARGTRGPAYFDRRFVPAETQEVRVYLHGSDDSAVVRGSGITGIKLRLIGGTGDNALIDSSRVALDHHATHLYDDGPGPHHLTYGPDTLFSRRPQLVQDGDTVIPPPDFGSAAAPTLRTRYLTDLGFVFGAGLNVRTYAFRTYPYWYRTTLWVEHGTGVNDTRGELGVDVYREHSLMHVEVHARASGLAVTRYYGQGNETVRTGTGDYSRLEHSQYRFETLIARRMGSGYASIGPALEYYRTAGIPTGVPTSAAQASQPYGSGDFGQIGLRAYAGYDSRDNPGAPRRGLNVLAGASWFPPFRDATSAFGDVHGEATAYLGVEAPLRPVLALRVGGKKVWGAYPFFESAFLGGYANLRGFDQQRFAGNASAWGNAELRLRLTTIKLLIPGSLGIHGMADAGRVWAPGEHSSTWHTAFGGGVWFNVAGPVSTMSATIARSDERTGVYVLAGFGF